MKHFKHFFLLSTLVVFLSACSGYNKILKSTDYNYKLKKANEYFDKKKYLKAQTLYQDVINYFKATDNYEVIFYRYAYCAYYLNDNYSAQILFKEYIAKFPQSDKVEEVDFMHALSYYLESPNYHLDQSNTVKAMNLMQIFLTTYPNSSKKNDANDVISKCREKLELKEKDAAELYYNAEQYKAAAIYYNQLVQEFPESMKAEEYKFLAIKSLYEYANLSIAEKQLERYGQILKEYEDFSNRFSESKYLAQIKTILNLSENKIKKIQNELTTTTR